MRINVWSAQFSRTHPENFYHIGQRQNVSTKTDQEKIFLEEVHVRRGCVVWVKVLRMPNMLTELKLLLMFVSWLDSLASKIGLGGTLYASLCNLLSEDDLWF